MHKIKLIFHYNVESTPQAAKQGWVQHSTKQRCLRIDEWLLPVAQILVRDFKNQAETVSAVLGSLVYNSGLRVQRSSPDLRPASVK